MTSIKILIKLIIYDHWFYHIKTSQLIYNADPVTGFYVTGTLRLEDWS